MNHRWLPLALVACAAPTTQDPVRRDLPDPVLPPDTGLPSLSTGDTSSTTVDPYPCFANRVRTDLVTEGILLTALIGYDDSFDEPLRTYEATDIDGDNLADTVVRLAYDDRGFLITTATERDGEPVNFVYMTNDSRGNVLVGRADNDANGSIDAVTTMTYDDNDLVLTRDTDHDGDEVADRSEVYEREPDGRLLAHTLALGGQTVRLTTVDYDDQDRISLWVQDDFVIDALDERRTYDYADETGPDYTRTTDLRDDGVADRIDVVSHDDEGRVTLIEADADVDEIVDVVTRLTYGDDGEVLTLRIEPDDPSLVELTTYTYDDRGRRVRTHVVQPPDGPLVAGTDDVIVYGGTCE